MEIDSWYWDILDELDVMNAPITEWEADFLENLLAHRGCKLSDGRKETIEKMKERYLA